MADFVHFSTGSTLVVLGINLTLTSTLVNTLYEKLLMDEGKLIRYHAGFTFMTIFLAIQNLMNGVIMAITRSVILTIFFVMDFFRVNHRAAEPEAGITDVFPLPCAVPQDAAAGALSSQRPRYLHTPRSRLIVPSNGSV
jgi:alpha-D-ribose 1-methylphosphonate 5-triphosphate synthase subunit PhnL